MRVVGCLGYVPWVSGDKSRYDVGKESQLLLRPTEVQLGVQCKFRVEFDNKCGYHYLVSDGGWFQRTPLGNGQ